MASGSSRRWLHQLSHTPLEKRVNNHVIECSESKNYLGLKIDQCLSFVKHIVFVCRNVTSKIFLLSEIKQYHPVDTRRLYNNAYILPVMDNCMAIWGSAPKYQLDRLPKLQKRAARNIFDIPPNDSSMPFFNNYDGSLSTKDSSIIKLLSYTKMSMAWLLHIWATFLNFPLPTNESQVGVQLPHAN